MVKEDRDKFSINIPITISNILFCEKTERVPGQNYQMSEFDSDPCPYRILEHTGGGLALGLIGGSLFHGIRGFRNAPSGMSRRFQGSVSTIQLRSRKVAGSFALWGGLIAAVECSLALAKGKEDSWTRISSGALTGGILAIRKGVPAIVGQAFIGGVLLAMIEGFIIVFARFEADLFRGQARSGASGPNHLEEDSRKKSGFTDYEPVQK